MKPIDITDDYYAESKGIAFNQDFNKKIEDHVFHFQVVDLVKKY